jgi:lipid-binding SYLF domain-containing protein
MERLTMKLTGAVAVGVLVLAGCASAPQTRTESRDLLVRADEAIESMVAQDQTLRGVLDEVYGYAVFPRIAEGAFLIGGAAGVGVLYEEGEPVGFLTMNHGTVGAQVGGQAFTEIVVFQTREAVERVKAGNFDLTANAGVTVITAGSAARTHTESGTHVYIDDEDGLMAGVSVGGQTFGFEPLT